MVLPAAGVPRLCCLHILRCCTVIGCEGRTSAVVEVVITMQDNLLSSVPPPAALLSTFQMSPQDLAVLDQAPLPLRLGFGEGH